MAMTNRKVSNSRKKRSHEMMVEDAYDWDEEASYDVHQTDTPERGRSRSRMYVSQTSNARAERHKYPHPLSLVMASNTSPTHGPPSPEFTKNFDELFAELIKEDSSSIPSSPPSDFDDLFEVEKPAARVDTPATGQEGASTATFPVGPAKPPSPLDAGVARAQAAQLRFEQIKERAKRRRLNPPPPPPVIIFTRPSPSSNIASSPSVDKAIIVPTLLQANPWQPRAPTPKKRPSILPLSRLARSAGGGPPAWASTSAAERPTFSFWKPSV